MIIDAENQVLGRIATHAAKQVLLGEKVDIVNCEKAIITGNKREVIAKYKNKRSRGVPKKGPFFPKQPDRFVRRTVRGMLPYKKPRGREAFRRVMCYNGVPEAMENKKFEKFKDADVSMLKNLKYVQVRDVCMEIGGKV